MSSPLKKRFGRREDEGGERHHRFSRTGQGDRSDDAAEYRRSHQRRSLLRQRRTRTPPQQRWQQPSRACSMTPSSWASRPSTTTRLRSRYAGRDARNSRRYHGDQVRSRRRQEQGDVTREIEGGQAVVEVPLPAVFSAQKGLNEPRYASLPGIMKARRSPSM